MAVPFKATKQRKLLLHVLEQAEKPLTAVEIYDRCSEKACLNLSTVYRSLHVLESNSLVLKSISLDKIARYQLKGKLHRHSLVCMVCKKAVALNACPLNPLKEELEHTTGFEITGHLLEFYGICPDCAALRNPSDCTNG